ncbi:MAG: DnrO protein [Lysobacteraceae bacterium]
MRNLVTFLLLVALGIVARLAGAQHHEHATAAPAAAAAPAQRFATDATLREQMRGIRVAVEGLDHYAHGHLEPAQATRLAGQVEERVLAIIANCKLPPDADAALHAIIVPLMRNAVALKQDARDTAAIQPMRDALAQYALRFDDPGVAQ